MISKKRLLEIEKERKEKLYSQGSGRRNFSTAPGKIAAISGAGVLIVVAAALIFYANTMTPVKEKAVEPKAEVDVSEDQKEVAVVEEVEVQLHPALQKKAEEVAVAVEEEKPEKVDMTFYDDLARPEATPLEEGIKAEVVPEAVPETPVTPAVKEKKIVEKTVAKPETPAKVATPVVSVNTPGNYRIQIASFREEAEAESRRAELEKDGYRARKETADLGSKGVWYRVYVEDYSSRNAAKGDLDKIANKYHIQPFIVKKP